MKLDTITVLKAYGVLEDFCRISVDIHMAPNDAKMLSDGTVCTSPDNAMERLIFRPGQPAAEVAAALRELADHIETVQPGFRRQS